MVIHVMWQRHASEVSMWLHEWPGAPQIHALMDVRNTDARASLARPAGEPSSLCREWRHRFVLFLF